MKVGILNNKDQEVKLVEVIQYTNMHSELMKRERED